MHEGEGLGKGEVLLGNRHLAAMGPHDHRPPGSRASQSDALPPQGDPRNRFADELSVEVQLFKAAPSGTMPCVANRHSAIRSFLATATIAIRRMRPRRVPTNAANQRLIADPGW